ncbi:MAG: hypothetical protein ABIB71_07290, partial [Candidatus Woesearchaeota archaeon]
MARREASPLVFIKQEEKAKAGVLPRDIVRKITKVETAEERKEILENFCSSNGVKFLAHPLV